VRAQPAKALFLLRILEILMGSGPFALFLQGIEFVRKMLDLVVCSGYFLGRRRRLSPGQLLIRCRKPMA